MTSLFIDVDEEITIKIFVGKTANGLLVADADLLVLKEGDNPISGDVEEYEVICRQPNFKDSVEISSSLFNYSTDEGVGFNPLSARYEKMVKLIKSWSLKGKDGKEMGVSDENIAKLHPVIATAIGTQLDLQVPTV